MYHSNIVHFYANLQKICICMHADAYTTIRMIHFPSAFALLGAAWDMKYCACVCVCTSSQYHLTESIITSITVLGKELELQYSPTHTPPPPSHSPSITPFLLISTPLFSFFSVLKQKLIIFFSHKKPMSHAANKYICYKLLSIMSAQRANWKKKHDWKKLMFRSWAGRTAPRKASFFLSKESRTTDLHLDGTEQTPVARNEKTFTWNYFLSLSFS